MVIRIRDVLSLPSMEKELIKWVQMSFTMLSHLILLNNLYIVGIFQNYLGASNRQLIVLCFIFGPMVVLLEMLLKGFTQRPSQWLGSRDTFLCIREHSGIPVIHRKASSYTWVPKTRLMNISNLDYDEICIITSHHKFQPLVFCAIHYNAHFNTCPSYNLLIYYAPSSPCVYTVYMNFGSFVWIVAF